MQTRVIAAPTYDMGQAVIDQPLDDTLGVAWQVSLSGFGNHNARLVSVSGAAVLMSHVHGVLALGAAPPNIQSDLWPVPVRVKGSSYPGQMMVADDTGVVYRLSPGQIPVPVRNGTYHPDDVGVVGLAGGRLLVNCFDDSWSETELVDEATGQVVWSAPISLAPVMPVDDQLIGNVSGTSGDVASLDVRTGLERWRNERWGGLDIVAVVGDVLWLTDMVSNTLVGYDVDSGREVATVGMPRESRLIGTLDQSGNLHIGDEHGWLIVDLTEAKVVADVRFEGSGMGDVYGHRAVRSADGRLVLADDRGQVFVVHSEQPRRPEFVATCPPIRGIGIAAGRLIVLSHDGTLTAIGAPL